MDITPAQRERLRHLADTGRVVELTNTTLLGLLDALDASEAHALALTVQLAATQQQLVDVLDVSNTQMERVLDGLKALEAAPL